VLEILKHDKIRGGGQFAIASPHFKFWGRTRLQYPPVIYAHGFSCYGDSWNLVTCCTAESEISIAKGFNL